MSKRELATKILGSFKNCFKADFRNMTKAESLDYLDFWDKQLSKVTDIEDRFFEEALDYYLTQYTDRYCPTTGMFISEARKRQNKWRYDHPIRHYPGEEVKANDGQ